MTSTLFTLKNTSDCSLFGSLINTCHKCHQACCCNQSVAVLYDPLTLTFTQMLLKDLWTLKNCASRADTLAANCASRANTLAASHLRIPTTLECVDRIFRAPANTPHSPHCHQAPLSQRSSACAASTHPLGYHLRRTFPSSPFILPPNIGFSLNLSLSCHLNTQ